MAKARSRKSLHRFLGKDLLQPEARRNRKRRRIRKGQRVNCHGEGRNGRNPHRHRSSLNPEAPDEEAGYNPAGRPKHADRTKLLLRTLHLAEGEGIGKGHGRHVTDGVEENQNIQRAESGTGGGIEE